MNVSSVGRGVNTTKDSFAAVFLRGTKAERKHLRVEEILFDHLVKWWHNTVDRDGVVSKAENAIESSGSDEELFLTMKSYTNVLAERECESWLLGSFSKILVLDDEITNGHNVLGDKAFHGSRAILD